MALECMGGGVIQAPSSSTVSLESFSWLQSQLLSSLPVHSELTMSPSVVFPLHAKKHKRI